MAPPYLVIIDLAPLDKDLKHYFSQFEIEIVQKTTVHSPQINPHAPIALLIDYSVLKNNLEHMSCLFKQYPVPLLITSDKREETFCIHMLEAGADDYLIKPLYPREVHARINAISRRILNKAHQLESKKEVITFSHWRIYPASRQIFDHHNNELLLSAGEYELLLLFIKHPQKILSREFLLQVTKQNDQAPFDRRIDVQISRLRHKIEYDARQPILIRTIRNGGYMFTASVTLIEETNCDHGA
jgi:two-component system, OmpR family, response regulator